MAKLVLFDIDYTLVVGIQAHAQAFLRAYKTIYGVETQHERIYHNFTDLQIIHFELKRHGLSETEVTSKLPQCLEFMAREYKKLVAEEKFTVLPGVPELLTALSQRKILMGLVTGNLKDIAKAKLEKTGLWHHFGVGGFGSDGAERNKLAQLAVERARTDYKFPADGEVFSIGDAPADMEAGKVVGAKTIGITTSVYSPEQLKVAGADVVLENLADTKRVLQELGIV